MLRRPEGARLSELMSTFGWLKHSTRGFLSGVVGKRLGYKIASAKADGDRVYRIVGGGPRAATAG